MTISAQQLDSLRDKVQKKLEQLQKLQSELEVLQAELKTAASEFMRDCGLETVSEKKQPSVSRKSAGQRWRSKAIVQFIQDNDSLTTESLKSMLLAEKPNASLDRLADILEQYTTNSGGKLKLNAEGKKLLA